MLCSLADYKVEAGSDDLGHYQLFSSSEPAYPVTGLTPCTFPEGAASDDRENIIRPCENDHAQWVRVLLPGAGLGRLAWVAPRRARAKKWRPPGRPLAPQVKKLVQPPPQASGLAKGV